VDELVEEIARRTVALWPDLALGTRTARPKAWGALAAHGLTALREQLGRGPAHTERRALWAALWREAHRSP
jgi:hypothetical protein